MNIPQLRRTAIGALAFLALSLSGCGSGGSKGTDNFSGAADIQMDVAPTRLDTGDRIEVKINLKNVHQDGIALKFRTPTALVYVPDSAELEVNSDEIEIDPIVRTVVDNDRYIVFYLSGDDFEESDGVFTMQLEAQDDFEDKSIEVDVDVDDVEIPNESEFDENNPEFSPEDEALVTVER